MSPAQLRDFAQYKEQIRHEHGIDCVSAGLQEDDGIYKDPDKNTGATRLIYIFTLLTGPRGRLGDTEPCTASERRHVQSAFAKTLLFSRPSRVRAQLFVIVSVLANVPHLCPILHGANTQVPKKQKLGESSTRNYQAKNSLKFSSKWKWALTY